MLKTKCLLDCLTAPNPLSNFINGRATSGRATSGRAPPPFEPLIVSRQRRHKTERARFTEAFALLFLGADAMHSVLIKQTLKAGVTVCVSV